MQGGDDREGSEGQKGEPELNLKELGIERVRDLWRGRDTFSKQSKKKRERQWHIWGTLTSLDLLFAEGKC